MDLLPAAVFSPAPVLPATRGEQVALPAPPPAPAKLRLSPETLHPALWLGHQLGRQAEHAVASGFAALDAQLPGGGWPRRVLTELLLAHPGVGEIRLLAPSLAATQAAGRLVMLFDPPAALSAWRWRRWVSTSSNCWSSTPARGSFRAATACGPSSRP